MYYGIRIEIVTGPPKVHFLKDSESIVKSTTNMRSLFRSIVILSNVGKLRMQIYPTVKHDAIVFFFFIAFRPRDIALLLLVLQYDVFIYSTIGI